MSHLFNGTTSNLELGSAILTAVPMTMACWFNPADATHNDMLITLSEKASSGGIDGIRLIASGTITNDPVRGAIVAASSAQFADTVSPGFIAQKWNHGAFVLRSATSRTSYINGVRGGTVTNSIVPSGLDRTNIGAFWDVTLQAFYSGLIAEACIWNCALTTAEVQALAAGAISSSVRPDSIVMYLPLRDDTLDYSVFRNFLTNTAVVRNSDHPVIYDPRPYRKRYLVDAAGGGTSVALTGVSATSASGSLGVKFSIPLTGVSGTSAVGTLTPTTGTFVALTGNAATGSIGSFGVKFNIPLVGQSVTASVGTLTPQSGTIVALSGVSATGDVGNLGVQFGVALTGVLASVSIGNMGPPAPSGVAQGMGPGWNLFHHQPERVREPDSVRSDIEHALEKAEEARSPKAKREAVKELKAVTAEAAKTATEIPGLEFMAMRLERALQLKQSASALIADIRRVVEAQRLQEQDDLEAFMIMAELA